MDISIRISIRHIFIFHHYLPPLDPFPPSPSSLPLQLPQCCSCPQVLLFPPFCWIPPPLNPPQSCQPTLYLRVCLHFASLFSLFISYHICVRIMWESLIHFFDLCKWTTSKHVHLLVSWVMWRIHIIFFFLQEERKTLTVCSVIHLFIFQKNYEALPIVTLV